MICIIGNAPSSGSTFLADLLDSSPHSVCGPELNLFSNRKIYDFEVYRSRITVTSSSGSIHRKRLGLNLDRLYSYGLDRRQFTQMAQAFTSFPEFIDKFARQYKAMRGKDQSAVFCEKTPENINAIGEFLETFEKGYFIHIVRDPLRVQASLLRRGFAPRVALLTWLLDVAMVHPYREHPRVLTIRYEELVRRPFELAVELIERLSGRALAPAELQERYEHNDYRREHSKKIASWTVREYGTVRDANRQELVAGLRRDAATLWGVRIRQRYADAFGMSALSFREAVTHYGYADALRADLGTDAAPRRIPALTAADAQRLTRKWLGDLAHGEARLGQLSDYLCPVEPV